MKNLDVTFAALSHETRRQILAHLRRGETRLSDLAEPFDITQTAVSKHVKVLSDAGLLVVERRGRTRHCRLVAHPMQDAAKWLTDYQVFWHKQFDNLTQHFIHEDT